MTTQPGRFPDDTENSPDASLPPDRGDRWAEADGIIYLDRYLRGIRRRWLLIFVAALLGGAIAFWFASSQPLRYQGVTTLLVVPPSEPRGVPINPATFRAIVENATLAAQVISELKLDAGEFPFTPLRFLKDALRVEEIRGTNVVRITVTLHDPGTAAEAARRLASKAITLTQQIIQKDGSSIQEQLQNHLADAQRRLASSEKDLLAYKQGAQVDLLKEDADAQLKERGDLLRLVVDIEAEKSRLAAAMQEIKLQQPLLTASRLPAAEEALRRAAEEALRRQERVDQDKTRQKGDQPTARKPVEGSKGVDPQHLDLTNPYVNPVYQTLDFQIATSRTRIAALEKQRNELVDVKKIGGKDLAILGELYRRQIELARLEANFELAKRVHGDLAVRYEQSRTQPLGSTPQLQVVDDAIPPDQPVSQRRLQYSVFGAAAGLIMAVMLALLLESRGR